MSMSGQETEDWLVDDDTADLVEGLPLPPLQRANEFPPWQVLVVDDEPEVHTISQLVLRDVVYRGRALRLLHAYCAAEAWQQLQANGDIAVILLDVVMESDDAGLQLVREIRETLGNTDVRIILRTGQPGMAPEREVIDRYEIDDYKCKADLTSQQLYTSIVVALRAFEYIRVMQRNRVGLEKVIAASGDLYQQRSLELFATGVLTQLGGFMQTSEDGILCARRGNALGVDQDQIYVLAGSGRYETLVDRPLDLVDRPLDKGQWSERVVDIVWQALTERRHDFGDCHTALYLPSSNQRDLAIYFDTGAPTNPIDRRLLEVFCANIAVGMENIQLFEQLKLGQRATIVALADLAEHRDLDTGEHVLRVARMTEDIARQLMAWGEFPDRLSTVILEHIGMASMLHDVGKVSIPDRVLHKSGPLNEAERLLMQSHAHNGGRLLDKAARYVPGSRYLALAADIANHHHEWYNGKGYPSGLVGEAIPLPARIVSVADVYDALVSRRPYKAPWPIEQAVTYIQERAGSQFDPRVVAAFVEVIAQRDEG